MAEENGVYNFTVESKNEIVQTAESGGLDSAPIIVDDNSNVGNNQANNEETRSQASDDSSDGKIFVGGIPWQTTDANLHFYFEQFGELEDFVLMKDRLTGKPRGFGFIKYKDPKAVEKILEQDHIIDGRSVDVKRATPRSQANASNSGRTGRGRPGSTKIFVGGLEPMTTDSEFRAHFEKYGAVKDCTIVYDKITKRPRGFGFLEFSNISSVEKCLNDKHVFNGKEAEVKEAVSKDQYQMQKGTVGYVPGYAAPAYGGMGYGGGYANRMPRGYPAVGGMQGYQTPGNGYPQVAYGYGIPTYGQPPRAASWTPEPWAGGWGYQTPYPGAAGAMPRGHAGRTDRSYHPY